jgi:hypothetical protein
MVSHMATNIKIRKPKITDRWEALDPRRYGLRGSSARRTMVMVKLEDGREMSMAEYRALTPVPESAINTKEQKSK